MFILDSANINRKFMGFLAFCHWKYPVAGLSLRGEVSKTKEEKMVMKIYFIVELFCFCWLRIN
jgi:hypothetical protein